MKDNHAWALTKPTIRPALKSLREISDSLRERIGFSAHYGSFIPSITDGKGIQHERWLLARTVAAQPITFIHSNTSGRGIHEFVSNCVDQAWDKWITYIGEWDSDHHILDFMEELFLSLLVSAGPIYYYDWVGYCTDKEVMVCQRFYECIREKEPRDWMPNIPSGYAMFGYSLWCNHMREVRA